MNPFANIFKIPELRRRVLFMIGMLFIYRLGAHVPTPGVNGHVMNMLISQQAGGFLGFLDLMSGGALKQFTIFSLGIMPYISASIILQLLTSVIPALEALSKEGDAGRKKITQYTRYLTVGICAIQSFAVTMWMKTVEVGGTPLVQNSGFVFILTSILTLTAGTIFLMWLGEQMTEYGIGNGMSILILAGIIASIPGQIARMIALMQGGTLSLFQALLFIVAMIGLTAVAVISQQSFRKIPVQYAQRIVGRKIYRGQSTQLPLKIDYSGVIAVIFASSVMIIPSMIGKLFERPGQSDMVQNALAMIQKLFSAGNILYVVLYSALIIFFCYFYTAISFNPNDLAENMKKNGGFVPGIRPGQPTADYINDILTHITLGGALLIVAIAIIPDLLGSLSGIGMYFGGTTLLIMVGVSLDLVQQVEAHLLMRHYDGFMKSGKIRGRRL
ncbi:MAG TPA: preprotein translocase subunit SecY [Candidatus Goldiibacteriota bacterium]|nr:preprotein translocase subunit SecY [Candidatus Goldiibacteriota bacterium]